MTEKRAAVPGGFLNLAQRINRRGNGKEEAELFITAVTAGIFEKELLEVFPGVKIIKPEIEMRRKCEPL